jgi:serine/threonine protein kinase
MEEGELVAERYRLATQIGRGAMGVVWLARDERLDREVAVKLLLLKESPDPSLAKATPEQVTQRAMREARIAARLRHPNAISVHDVVEHDGRPCLVMEYLKCQSLDVVMVARGGLPPHEAAAIGMQIAGALADAHAAGIVHRDVKPENVLITEDGTAKISDFGVSRATGVDTVTTTGVLAGTPAYLAPEVASGGEASPKSDVYSLGAALYTAIEGMPPHGLDENPIALLMRVATCDINLPQRSGPMTELLLWMLRRDPEQRPTMTTAKDALAAAADGRAFPVPPRTPTMLMSSPPVEPPRSRFPRRAVLAGLVATSLVAAGVVLGAVLTSKSPPDDTANGSPGSTGSTPNTRETPQQPAFVDATCVATYKVVGTWPDGYNVDVTIRNDGDQTLSGWEVRWALPEGHEITTLWSGTLTRDGTEMTVTNADWNITVAPGAETTFGFTASATDADRPIPQPSCEQL